jgi:multiple antibiotic resistance protein
MPTPLKDALEFALLAFTSVFFLVDPFAVVPAFLAITQGAEMSERRAMARRASWTCLIVLCGFALTGSLIFRVLGITLPAFKIAGRTVLHWALGG